MALVDLGQTSRGRRRSDSRSLLYSLEEADNGAVRVIWAGQSDYSASELLQTVRVDNADARKEAEDFLMSLLSDGAVPKASVEEEAKAAKISTGTLRRAKTSLGVIAERENQIGAREALDAGYGNCLLEKKWAVVFNPMMFNMLKEEIVSILNSPGAIDGRNPA